MEGVIKYRHLLVTNGKLQNQDKLKLYKIIYCTYNDSRMNVYLKLRESTPKKPSRLTWEEMLKAIQFELADWLLFNHHELMDLVLKEEYGVGSGNGSPDNSLDSQVERFITSNQHRLYILNMTCHYLLEMETERQNVYYLKYEDKLLKENIAIRLHISKDNVSEIGQEIKQGLLDELEECGILLDNIFRFRKKYSWVGENEEKATG